MTQMKSKIFGLMSLSIFALVLFVSFVSAAITFSNQDPSTLTQETGTFDIDVTSDQTEDITFTANTITDYNDKEITFVSQTVSFDDETITITVSYTVESDFDFFGKEYSTVLTANGTTSDDATKTLTFEQTPYYDGENQGDLKVSDISIDDNDFGKDEEYWYPLDNVEVKFNVANDGDWKIKDIEIKACLWDETKGKCIMDEDDMDLSDDKFDLKSDKDTDITMNFQVDPDKLTEGNTDYTLYIKAVGEIHDSDSIYDGDETGDSDSQEDLEIRTDEKFVIIDNIKLSEETVQCGEELRITADIWNIGDEDLDDDEVFIRVLNTDLGIDEKIEFSNGIDAMDKEKLGLDVQIPKNLEEQYYTIKITVYDDEDMDDNDIYENDEEDTAEYRKAVEVKGGCSVSSGAQALVSATFESGGNAGAEMIVKATITNTGDDSAIYTVNVADYTEWASSASTDKTTLSLAKGESESIMITLNVKSDASGSKSFDIELISDNQLVIKQPVTVSVEAAAGFNLIKSIRNNTILWTIGALNVILVVAIILVAIRLVTKS